MKSLKSKKYKALILDLDGTTVTSRKGSLPSDKVRKAILDAQKVIKVSIATGRPYSLAKDVIKKLKIICPCIVNGGSEIRNPITNKILFSKPISIKVLRKIVEISLPFKYAIYAGQEEYSVKKVKDIKRESGKIMLEAVREDELDKILKQLRTVTEIAAHPTTSWISGDVVDIHMTHIEATKQYAINELLKILNVKSEETIGVGDSHNDIPLLSSVGLKIAMGDAPEELKVLADYVAPTFKKDGVADVIDKFIL